MLDLMDDLFAYNAWANERVWRLCEGLDDAALDAPQPIGFGTLRATLYHILVAEEVWVERWERKPWRPFPKDPEGAAPRAMAERLPVAAAARQVILDAGREDRWSQEIEFVDSRQQPHRWRLVDQLLHVVNHGTHHRAQALQFLKRLGRSAGPGLDYIIYRLGSSAVPQSAAAAETLRGFGFDVAVRDDPPPAWDGQIVLRWFVYHDWATEQILNLAASAEEAQLDIDHNIGRGSIRGNLLHMYDAERAWVGRWAGRNNPVADQSGPLAIAELRGRWADLAIERNAWLNAVEPAEIDRVIEVSFGSGRPSLRFQLGETILQTVNHAVHHRSQVINQLRRTGVEVRNIDLLYALPELPRA